MPDAIYVRTCFARVLAAALAIVAVLLASRAGAQCTPRWQPFDASTAAFPGVHGQVKAMVLWDPDAAGPITAKLVVGGSFSISTASPLDYLPRPTIVLRCVTCAAREHSRRPPPKLLSSPNPRPWTIKPYTGTAPPGQATEPRTVINRSWGLCVLCHQHRIRNRRITVKTSA